MTYSPKIEAILYPSVPMEYISCNLAILPETFDEKFQFVKAEEFMVLKKTVNMNQWIYHKVAEAENLKDGKLNWVTSSLDKELLEFMKSNKVDMNEMNAHATITPIPNGR